MGLHRIYIFPGMGADSRLFKGLNFDPNRYEVHKLELLQPNPGESMATYARRFLDEITTDEPFSLIGVSLGGMVVTELADILTPSQAIIISSAKCRQELPRYYRMLRYFPIHRMLPPAVLKAASFMVERLFEPDRKRDEGTFKAMLKSASGRAIKQWIRMIIEWGRTNYSDCIFHIHGSADHIIPIGSVKVNSVVEGGSHMMVLSKSNIVQQLLNNRIQ